jgi:glucosamine 6-phosphate synthetase-like amidotransferase/phosphosugar isomerase protein
MRFLWKPIYWNSSETFLGDNSTEMLKPFYDNFPIQLFAYHVAMEKFKLAEQRDNQGNL